MFSHRLDHQEDLDNFQEVSLNLEGFTYEYNVQRSSQRICMFSERQNRQALSENGWCNGGSQGVD
jgi:hypothetical protein